MMFPRCFKRRHQPTPAHTTHQPSEATVARIRAQAELEHTKAQTPRYRALGDSLRELRERNHFAEAFENAFQKGRT